MVNSRMKSIHGRFTISADATAPTKQVFPPPSPAKRTKKKQRRSKEEAIPKIPSLSPRQTNKEEAKKKPFQEIP